METVAPAVMPMCENGTSLDFFPEKWVLKNQ
jgi:hypothetical protein